ncbi:MAG: nucleotidyltransferase domain-containing protein [Patescibacteria group bacterium]
MEKEYIDKCTMFSTIVGSHAYGTNNEDSDTDIRGIAVLDDKSYYFGFLKKFEQYEYPNADTVIYDIRKAFSLMADANPNMLDIIFADEKFHQKVDDRFKIVLDNRDKFLSKRARFTYTGYSYSQLKRIKSARSWLLNPPKKKPERSDFGLPEQGLISKDNMGALQWIMANMLKDSVSYLNFSDATKKELEDANWIGLIQQQGIPENGFEHLQKAINISDEFMAIMQKEQAYNNAKRHFDSYTQWKNSRNKKRAILEEKYGYDAKHAMHLVRLLRMGKEILTEGKVLVFRPDREELKEIRNGSWSYEQVEEYAETMEKEIASLYEASKIPKEPNRNEIDKLCVEVIEKCLMT